MNAMNRWSNRIVWLAVWAGMLALGLFGGNDAAWFLTGGMGAVLLYALAIPRLSLRGMKAEAFLAAARVATGEEAVIQVVLTRASRLPLPWLTMTGCWLDESGAEAYRGVALAFPWMRRTVSCRNTAVAARRGIFPVYRIQVAAGDVFGLSTTVKSFLMKGGLTVCPRPVVPASVQIQPTAAGERDAAIRRFDTGFPVPTVRDYVPGDPLNRIHWKASARSGDWKTREVPAGSSGRVMVFVDGDDGMEPQETPGKGGSGGWKEWKRPAGSAAGKRRKRQGGSAESKRRRGEDGSPDADGAAGIAAETAASAAAGMLALAAEAGTPAGLAYTGKRPRVIPPRAVLDAAAAGTHLAAFTAGGELDFAAFVRREAAALPADTAVWCVTAAPGERLLACAAELRRQKRAVGVLHVRPGAASSGSASADEAEAWRLRLQSAGCAYAAVTVRPQTVPVEQGHQRADDGRVPHELAAPAPHAAVRLEPLSPGATHAGSFRGGIAVKGGRLP